MNKRFTVKGFNPSSDNNSGNQAKQFISAKYSPTGAPEEKEFRTTMELQYELREMVLIFESTVNEAMNEMGFQIEYLDNKPNWVLYLK